ncbi:MAG: DUF4287 domain-containing protein [Acidobacteriaceae bacterium]|nr:DUF4287 domain-containing protein [Acidobacteriaceae bacterium]MBV9502837.1 DUF4287 domain-containing protein [Acidobacteriaceae bacterium]
MTRTDRKARQSSPYSEHAAVAMEAKAISGLKEKTGRTLEEWIALTEKFGPNTEKERAAWLKQEHGLGTNYAKWIAYRAEGKSFGDQSPSEYVEAMYSGSKAGLRPIHDRLVELAVSLGKDVTLTPCSTIVPIRRRHVIAQIKPATNTRIDFGLALRDTKPTGRLIDTGGFAKKDRITHRIPITSVSEIDGEVKNWLRKAYEIDE